MTEPPRTIGQLLGQSLRAIGVTRVFGSGRSGITGIEGLGHLRVDEPHLAALLADAHGRVSHGRHPGSAVLPGRRLRIGSQPGAPAVTVAVTDAATLVEAVASAGAVPGAVELELDVDLDDPAPADVEPLAYTSAGDLITLSPSLAELGLVVLAGPGVLRAGEAAALDTFIRQSGLPLVTSLGGLGLAPVPVVGLQERDGVLAGLEDAAFVVTVGLDPDEEPPRPTPEQRGADSTGAVTGWTSRQTLDVEPRQLVALAHGWTAPAQGTPPVSPLSDALAPVLTPMLASDASPLTPARAAADLAVLQRAVDGKAPMIAADAGVAGLWVARALQGRPSTGERMNRPGEIVLPARNVRGFAVAAAIVAALDHRPATAVTVGPLDAVTAALVELAARVGSRLTVVEWGADVTWADARAHRVALHEARDATGIAHVPVPVDLTATRELVEVAGPVVAWRHAEAEGFVPYAR